MAALNNLRHDKLGFHTFSVNIDKMCLCGALYVNFYYSKDLSFPTHHHTWTNQTLGMVHLNTVVEKNTETLKLTVRYIHNNRNRMSEKTKARRKVNKYRHLMIKSFGLELLVCILHLRESEKVIYWI